VHLTPGALLWTFTEKIRELGWQSGESARLPPMCPGFDSQTWRHMLVEFVVGSRPSSEGVSPGSPVFLPPQKSTFLNSNSNGNSRATGLSVEDCYVLPLLNKQSQFCTIFAKMQTWSCSRSNLTFFCNIWIVFEQQHNLKFDILCLMTELVKGMGLFLVWRHVNESVTSNQE